MNLANKITMSRIYLAVLMLFVLMFPWYQLGIEFPMLNLIGKINIDSKYLVAGVLFIVAALTDFFDSKVARKYNMVTDFGKMIDAISDKILTNTLIKDLADKIGISTRTLARYEEGKNEPTLSILVKLSQIFNVSIDYIAGTKQFELTDFKEIREDIQNLDRTLEKVISMINKE